MSWFCTVCPALAVRKLKNSTVAQIRGRNSVVAIVCDFLKCYNSIGNFEFHRNIWLHDIRVTNV